MEYTESTNEKIHADEFPCEAPAAGERAECFEGSESTAIEPVSAGEMQFHGMANVFPMMPETSKEFKALVDDMKEHGQREPILLSRDGRILDGRNRYRACRKLGTEPAVRTYDGDESPSVLMELVLSLNIHRRHLTPKERAEAVLEAEDLVAQLRQKARDRIVAGVHNPSAPTDAGEESLETGKTSKILARMAGVGSATIERAIRARKERDRGRQAQTSERLQSAVKRRDESSLPFKHLKEAIPALSAKELSEITLSALREKRIGREELSKLCMAAIKQLKEIGLETDELRVMVNRVLDGSQAGFH